MSKVVTLDPREKEEQRRKAEMLECLDYIRKQVEIGAIKEFAAASLDSDGMAQIHVVTLDSVGGIGLFEIGKHLLISQEHQY